MKKLTNLDKINLLLSIPTTYKHLRGRHDQRDHAWNRGMGRGGTGSAAASSFPKKAKVSAAQHRADIVALQKKVDAGEMTYHEMQNKLRDNRGYPPLPPRTRKQMVQDNKGLAQAHANVRPLAGVDVAGQAAGSTLNNTAIAFSAEDIRPLVDIRNFPPPRDLIRSEEPFVFDEESFIKNTENYSLTDEQQAIFDDLMRVVNEELQKAIISARSWASGSSWTRSRIINIVSQDASDYEDSPYPRNIRTKPINKFNDLLRQGREQQAAEYKALNEAIEMSRSPDGVKNNVERDADSVISSLKNNLMNRYANIDFGESFFDSISQMSDEQQLSLLTEPDAINKFNAAGKYMELVATIAVAGKSEASKKAMAIAAANQQAEIDSGLSPHPDYNSTLSYIQDNSLQQIVDMIGTVPSTDILLKITAMSNEKNLNGKLANSILEYISDENTPNDIVKKQKYAELIQEIKKGRDDANAGFYKKNVDLYLSENDPDSVNDRTLINPAILPSIANAGIILQQQSMSDPNFADVPAAMQVLGLDSNNPNDWQLFADLLSIYVSDDGKSWNSGVSLSPGRIDSYYQASLPVAGKEISANRSIKINAETKSIDIYNISFKSKGQSRTGGVGHSMMTRQAAAAQEIAKRLGYVVRATTNAQSTVEEGATTSWNGFHTWPKLGYKFPIPSFIENDLMEKYGFTSDELIDTATFFLSQRLINGKTPADAWSDILNSYNETYAVDGEWFLSNPNELGLKVLQQYNDKVRSEKNKSTSYGDEFGFSEDDIAIYTDIWNKIARSKKTNIATVKERLKHLRGRHDQRDHAWNRGMGRGGSGSSAASSHPRKAKVSAEQHRADIVALQAKVDAGEITYHDMHNKLRDNRGYPPLPPRTRKQMVQDGKQLAQAQANVRPVASANISQQAAMSVSNNMLFTDTETPQLFRDALNLVEVLKEHKRKHDEETIRLQGIVNDDSLDRGDRNLAERELRRHERNGPYGLSEDIILSEVSLRAVAAMLPETLYGTMISYRPTMISPNPLVEINNAAKKSREQAAKHKEIIQKLKDDAQNGGENLPQLMEDLITSHKQLTEMSNTIASAIEQHVRMSKAKNKSTHPNGIPMFLAKQAQDIEKRLDEIGKRQMAISKELDAKQIQRYQSMRKTENDYYNDQKNDTVAPLQNNEQSKAIEALTNESNKNRDEDEKLTKKLIEMNGWDSTLKSDMLSETELMAKVYGEIFDNLKHPDAIPVSIIFTNDLATSLDTSKDKFSFKQKIALVRSVLGVIAPQSGDGVYTYSFGSADDNDSRAYFVADEESPEGTYHADANDSPAVVVHETLHAVQTYNWQLQRFLDKWAKKRVDESKERFTKLSEIFPGFKYEDNEVAVKDKVSNAYTLKKYRNENQNISFFEVLSTSFDSLFNDTEGMSDKEQLRLAIQALMQFFPVSETKTKSIYTRLKHLRGRHDQRDHAWNRGMGRGGTGSSAASSHPKKAKVSEAQHRADIIALQAKVDAGEMTHHDMQNKLRDNRGYPPLPPRTRKQMVLDNKGLAQAYANVEPLQYGEDASQLMFNPDGTPKTHVSSHPLYPQLSRMSREEMENVKTNVLSSVSTLAGESRQQSQNVRNAEAAYRQNPSPQNKQNWIDAHAKYMKTIETLSNEMSNYSLAVSVQREPYTDRAQALILQVSGIDRSINVLQKQYDAYKKTLDRDDLSPETRAVTQKIQDQLSEKIDQKRKEKETIFGEAKKLNKEVANAKLSQKYILAPLYSALRHPNPVIPTIAPLSQDMKAEFSSPDSLITADERAFFMKLALGMFPKTKGAVTISQEKEQRANSKTKEDASGNFQSKIKSNKDDTPMTYIHEALHITSILFPSMQQEHDMWAAKRAAQDPDGLRKMSEISEEMFPGLYENGKMLGTERQFKDNEVGYRDAVDNPYTLKLYGKSFSEVITMAFQDSWDIWRREDPDLLRFVLASIMKLK